MIIFRNIINIFRVINTGVSPLPIIALWQEECQKKRKLHIIQANVMQRVMEAMVLLFIMIVIKNKRTKTENILKKYPDAEIFDVTSKGEYKRLSPFYPHGGIPVPFSGTVTSASVEGIWQGLKVFESEGIDFRCFSNRTMKDLKRTVRTHGHCLGHQKGLGSRQLLGYIEARKEIYPNFFTLNSFFLANQHFVFFASYLLCSTNFNLSERHRFIFQH